MDASPITQALFLFVLLTVTTRFVLGPLARAGDGIVTLFGPQSHSLGWPRGVQEIDEPWAWRTAEEAAVDSSARRDDGGGDLLADMAEGWVDAPVGMFLVPIAPVETVRVGVRPR
jgi:hypothetical protein